MRVAITGATGFVGRGLTGRLAADGDFSVLALARRIPATAEPGVEYRLLDDLTVTADFRNALHGADVVVHTAARVHIMRDAASDPLAEFRRTNRDGTLTLARQAAAEGIRRFVFVSTVKVHGEATVPGRPFAADQPVEPTDPYAVSKREAEDGLHEIAARTGMEVVIVRPPLIYGPGVKANFARLMRWLALGIPLPLGSIRDNRRSLVALDNLLDLLTVCLRHPAAANRTFLVGDGEDLSTADLLLRLGRAMGKPAHLIPVPSALLIGTAALLGKSAMVRRLCDSLQADIGPTRDILGWTPPISVDEGLRRAAISI